MQFDPELIVHGTFIKRYKRFFVDVKLTDGTVLTAHCPNTGSMKGLLIEGAPCILTKADNPKRKLQYTWQFINLGCQAQPLWISVNTHLDNALVEEALHNKVIKDVAHYPSINREVKISDYSRCDFYLTGSESMPPCFLEVKHVHMNIDGVAAFPDSVTTRGQKHLKELMSVKKDGLRAVVIYVVNRHDTTSFRPAYEYDPDYAALFKESIQRGVEHYAYKCTITSNSIQITSTIPVLDNK
jgi:sugar fermentation stimulation protein A